MSNNSYVSSHIDDELLKYEQEQKAFNKNKKDLLSNYDRRSIVTNMNDPEVVQYQHRTQEDDQSIISSAWDGIKEFVTKDVPDFFTEDIPNAMRMINERRAQGFISGKQEQLRRLKYEDDAMSQIKEYQDLVYEWQELNTKEKTSDVVNRMRGIEDRLHQLDDYFTSKEGRQNPVIRELMYDIKSDRLTNSDISEVISGNLIYGMQDTPKSVKGESLYETAKNAASSVMTGIENAFTSIGNVGISLAAGVDKLASKIGLSDYDDGYATSKALSALPDGNPLINRLYKGANITTDIEAKKRKDLWQKHNRRLREQYNLELDKYIEDYTNGNWKVPLSENAIDMLKWFSPSRQYDANTGITINNVWDPEDVSQEWRNNQEKYTGSIWHPIYMLPEVGSTLGMIEGMIETIGLNVAAEAAIRKLPSLIAGGPTKKAIQMAFASGDINKGISLLKARSAAQTSNAVGLTEAAIRSGEIAGGIGITYGQRVFETNMEAIQAVSQRLQKSLNESGADAEKVLNAILDWENEHGVDVSRLSPTDLIGEAIARDINTGDPIFEKQKKEAQKGVMKLINANNALALHDYLEVIPMTSYGEKALSYFGKVISGSAPVATTRPFFARTAATANVGTRNIAQFYRDVAANRSLYAEEAARASLNPNYKKYYDTMFGAYDGAVEGMVKKLIDNKRLFTGMAVSRAANFIGGKLKALPYTMAMEGFEEGIQTTLQQRHEAGLYDNYTNGYQNFSISDVLETPELAGNVVSAFFGLNGKGDDEIVKTTVVGAFIGSLFPLAGGAITNFSSNPNNNNLRNLLTQLKNDKVATKIISENFDKIADEKKIRMFIEAFNRTGVNSARLTKSLNDLKSGIDDKNGIINSDFIDRDIQLLDAAWYMYNNKNINDQLKKRGIKKFSQEHKDIMTNGATIIADARRSRISTQEASKQIINLLDPTNSLIDELFDPNTSEDRINQIYSDNVELKNIVTSLLSQYDDYARSVAEQNSKNSAINKKQKDVVRDKATNMSAKELVELKVGDSEVVLDWVKQQLIKEGEINENSKYTKDYLIRKGIEMLSNEGYKKALVSHLTSVTPQLNEIELQPKGEYIKNYLEALNIYKQRKLAEGIKSWIDNDEQRISEIQTLTGMDLDTNMMKGMSIGLDEFIKRLKDTEQEYLKTENDAIKEQNKKRKEVGEDEIPYVGLDDVFKDKLGNLSYDFEDDYKKWVRSYILNSILLYAQERIASAYMDPQNTDPTQLNSAIFGNEAVSSYLFSDVDAYKKKKAVIDALPEADQKFSNVEQEDLRNMRQDASWKMIKHDLEQTRKERQRIVHPEQNILVESASDEEPESTSGVVTRQEQQQQNEVAQEQQDEELEKLLSEARDAADRVEVATMHKDPKELQRERSQQERRNRKAEQDGAKEVENNNKEDDKHPHSEQERQPETASPSIVPDAVKIPQKPEIPDDKSTVGDYIEDPIVIDGKYYYKYPVTRYEENLTTTYFVIADVDGNVIKDNPYAFISKAPNGYKIDISVMTPDDIGNLDGIQITKIFYSGDKAVAQSNLGNLPLIKDKPVKDAGVNDVVLQKITSLENDPQFGGLPTLYKTESGVTIVQIETLYKLSNGDIIGKIEENGQVYYYVVKATNDVDSQNTITYNIEKYNSKGQKVEDQGVYAQFDGGQNWKEVQSMGNDDNKFVSDVKVQYTEGTNIPISVIVETGTSSVTYNKIGVETRPEDQDEEIVPAPEQLDGEDDEQDKYEDQLDIQQQQNEDVDRIVDAYEEERLIKEEEERQDVEGESQKQLEDLLSSPGVVDVDENGKITIGGLVLDDSIQDSIGLQEELLYKLEFGIGLDQDDIPNLGHNKNESQAKDEAYDYVSDVFFYQPTAEKPMRLAINGKTIKLPYDLKPGSEFSKKLIEKGWIEDLQSRGKIYYIVSQAADAAHDNKNRTVDQDMDTFTVTLVIEDDKNQACYACSLRQLGKYMSLGRDKDPITGKDRFDEHGEPIMKEFFVDHEKQLREKLSRIHTVYGVGKSRQDTYENEVFGVAKTEYERLYGSRPQTPPENAPDEEWEKYKVQILDWEKKVKKWISDDYKVPRISGQSEEDYQESVNKRNETLRRIHERARYNLRQAGKRPMSDAKISEAIDNLRKVRNEIINAYLSRDDDGNFIWPDSNNPRTDVTPRVVVRSNGRFNNQKTEGGQPILKNVTRENNPFGIKQDVSSVNQQIQDNELLIGIGTGSVNSNNKNAIQDFREGNETQTWDGKGLAGKVFIIVDSVNNTKVPVMLSEAKFNQQHDGSEIPVMIGSVNDQLKLCINPYNGQIVVNDGTIPSAAEIILYLLFNKLDQSLLPADVQGLQSQFAQFFVHVGEETLLENSNVEAVLPYYAAKQLAIVNNTLIIGMPIVNEQGIPVTDVNGNVQYRQRPYTKESLFGLNPESEKNRMDVVRAIASQMHWNTEKVTMNEKFGGATTNLIAEGLEEYFNENPDQETFQLAGVPELSFNKHDLFEVDESDGTVVRIKRNMTMAAWLLCSGKLMSDVGDTVFKDPFVFANGVAISKKQELRKEAESSDSLTNTGDVDVTKLQAKKVIVLDDPLKAQNIRQKIGAANPNTPTAKAVFHSEQEYIDAMIESQRAGNSVYTQKYGPVVRVIALDLPTLASNSKITLNDLKSAVKEKVSDIIKNIDPKSIGSQQLYENEDTYASVTDNDYKAVMSPRTKWVLLARISEKGHVKLWATNYVGPNTRPQKGSINVINGVYQTEKTGGTFDEPYARQWLLDKLGLNKHQVFVTNALLRGTENEQVFGVTNVALDSLRDGIMGYMILSTQAGVGIQFHEAFHYVNLLLHTKEQRMAIYADYVKHHKKFKDKTFGEIEEAIAEDFRRYSEGVEGVSLSAKIRNFFRKLGDLLVVSRRKTAYRQVFNAIHSGYYRNNKHMDIESVKEFTKKYPQGVHQLRITGIPFYKTSDMKNIPTPRDFYEVGNAIVDFIIYRNRDNLRTVEDILSLGGTKFGDTLKQLKDYAETLDEATYGMIMDFYNNPDVLQYVIINKFAQFGIVAKQIKIDEDEDVDNSATSKEDSPDNTWDRFQFSISKKDSVMFRAKLFLVQIPQARLVPNEDGTKHLEYEFNEIIPDAYKYTRFDEAWNKIVAATNKCVGYGNRDQNGKFQPNSFRGIVERLAKADYFFAALNEKLDEIEGDFTLETQIYTAVNSQKPTVCFYEIQAAKSIRDVLSEEDIFDLDEESIAELQKKANENMLSDRMKQWVFRNDNTLQAVRNIPRRWSNSLLLSGVVDLKSSNQVISKQYAEVLINKIEDIRELYKTSFTKRNLKNQTEKEFAKYYYELSDRCISLCEYLGIALDQDVLDYFVNLKTESQSYANKSKILYDSFSKSSTGTIGYIVQLINNNAGNKKLINRASDASKKLKEPKEIDKIFSGTKLSSDISKLAMAYHALYPSSEDFGVFGPNKQMIYPISQNNFQSAKLRNLNITEGRHALDMMKSPYARHSIILNTAKEFEKSTPEEELFSLNLESGLKDSTSQQGTDFFGTTTLEDYIQQMLTLDQDPDFVPINAKEGYKSNESTYLCSPTMADKKTHYSISSKSSKFKTFHDPVLGVLDGGLIFDSRVADFADDMFGIQDPLQLGKNQQFDMIQAWTQFNPEYGYRKLSNFVLRRFADYFLDELDALDAYYKKENIKQVVDNKNKRISNFHGKVKGGMMDFSGNGGKFRYFYDTIQLGDDRIKNLNHRLEWLFKLEKDILSGKKIKIKSAENEDSFAALMDINPDAKNTKDFDGFELIRNELKRIRNLCFKNNGKIPTQFLLDNISNKLFSMIDTEIYKTSIDPSLKLSEWIPSLRCFVPVAIPAQLLSRQNARFIRNHKAGGSTSYIPYRNQQQDAVMFYSLMANHVINSITSIIEFEKVFSADPAQYKWKGISGEYATERKSMEYKLPSGEVIESEYYVSNVGDKFSDKIKRLGSILSPGDETRLDLSELEQVDEYLNPGGYLNSYHYTKLVVDDVVAKSEILGSVINPKFKNNLIADYVRNNDIKEVNDYIEARKKKDPKYDKERLINDILDNNKVVFYDELEETSNKVSDSLLAEDLAEYGVDMSYISKEGLDKSRKEYKKSKPTVSQYIFNILPSSIRSDINKRLKQQSGPYEGITVADAQIFMRPALYRKIRMSLGLWSVEEDGSGYSDEIAYRILEEDPSWQSDPDKAAIVSKLELFPLKMSYVGNEPYEISKGNNINLGTLDKAAYFPLFRYTASNQVGQKLYNRMNLKGQEIDCIAFVSAVKVGSPQQIPQLFKEESVGSLQDVLDNKSGAVVQYNKYSEDGKDVQYFVGKNYLPVQVQDLHLLRYQLNTKSHEATERALGTQAAKLGFSNIIDSAEYGRNKKGSSPRKGYRIKQDIIACIKALSRIEQQDLEDRYFKNVKGKLKLNDSKVHELFEKVAKSQNLGSTAEEILQNCVAESLTSRRMFEQKLSALIGKKIIDINLNGGTAVQQSMIGFNDYDNNNVISDEDLRRKNNILRSSISDVFDFLTDAQISELKDNNINTVEELVNSESTVLKNNKVRDRLEYLNIQVGDEAYDFYHKLNDGKEIKWQANENSMQVILSLNFFRTIIPDEFNKTYESARNWLLKNNIIGENSKPFGMGYRIPTQGMSSMFAFQVADVLPYTSGDVIIVPREFTAQTGSDFDVDKLFLATFTYEKGFLPVDERGVVGERSTVRSQILNVEDAKKARSTKELEDVYVKESKYAVQNKLLQNYIDIITDDRNYGEARGSIDVVTKIIGNDLLSWLKPASVSYIQGMSELLPSFQLQKKQEFKVGKDGIGPFALNTTNIGMTQLVHLSMDYDNMGVSGFEFGHLDELDGQDGIRIAAWLSAMINAHVDVAKDPYVFTLNVNKATYDYANFLLRAGKGMSTFTFLAQPILVEYATMLINFNGMYGRNLTGKDTVNKSKNQISNEIKKNLALKYLNELEYLLKQIPDSFKKENKEKFQRINEIITTTKYKHQYTSKQKSDYKKSHKGNAAKYQFSEKSIFSYNTAKQQIMNYRNPNNTIDKVYATAYQLLVLESFNRIKPCAQAISDLVQMSQIDTKKYGNTVMSQINYLNRVRQFKYSNEVPWIITTDSAELNLEPSHALRKYYSETFLDQKLESAIKYIKQLGARELLVCSDAFEQIFNDIASEANGQMSIDIPNTYLDKKGRVRVKKIKVKDKEEWDLSTKYIFNPFLNNDSVNALSTAIDNIMRFNILINMSKKSVSSKKLQRYETNPSRLLTTNSEDFDSYDYLEDGPIDFVYGGDYNSIVTNVLRLFYGDETQPSLPMRVKRFISDVLDDPYGEDAVGIVENGKIINDFLMYLNPVPSNKDFPIDRLNLNESAIRTSRQKKDLLQSYWNELLTHPSRRVRQLARDIAIYSYYSTYDTSSPNTITDLIPPYFRQFYDEAISDAVRERGVKLLDIISSFFGIDAQDEFIKKQGIGQLYYDVIARNYWYDDDIVHRVHEHGNGRMNTSSDYIEYRTAYQTDAKSKQKFPGMIISSNFGGHPLYVKLVKGSGSVLYRRIGVLEKLNKKGKNSLRNAYVYVAVQKAGMHSGKTHVFEYFKTHFVPSMFKQNMLPGEWNTEELIKDLVDNKIPSWTKSSQGYRYVFNPEDQFVMPIEDTQLLNKFIYKETRQSKQAKSKSILGGNMRVSLKKNPKKDAQNFSDLIIKFVTSDSAINKEDPLYNKTVYVNINDENAIQSISLRLQELKLDKKAGRSIYIDMNEPDFSVSEDEIENQLNVIADYQVQIYMEDNQFASERELETVRENVFDTMRDYAIQASIVQKMATAANISLQTMIMNGYSLTAMYASGLNNATRAAVNAYQRNIDSFSTPLMSNLFVSKEEYKNEDYENTVAMMEQSVQMQDLYVEDAVISEENSNLEENEDNKDAEVDNMFAQFADDADESFDAQEYINDKKQDSEDNTNPFAAFSADDDESFEENEFVQNKKDEDSINIQEEFKKPESKENSENGKC